MTHSSILKVTHHLCCQTLSQFLHGPARQRSGCLGQKPHGIEGRAGAAPWSAAPGHNHVPAENAALPEAERRGRDLTRSRAGTYSRKWHAGMEHGPHKQHAEMRHKPLCPRGTREQSPPPPAAAEQRGRASDCHRNLPTGQPKVSGLRIRSKRT